MSPDDVLAVLCAQHDAGALTGDSAAEACGMDVELLRRLHTHATARAKAVRTADQEALAAVRAELRSRYLQDAEVGQAAAGQAYREQVRDLPQAPAAGDEQRMWEHVASSCQAGMLVARVHAIAHRHR